MCVYYHVILSFVFPAVSYLYSLIWGDDFIIMYFVTSCWLSLSSVGGDNFIMFLYYQGDFVVDTTLVGVVMNGLSHLHNVQDKTQFGVGLVRGLGGNLPEATREKFANEVTISLIIIEINFLKELFFLNDFFRIKFFSSFRALLFFFGLKIIWYTFEICVNLWIIIIIIKFC